MKAGVVIFPGSNCDKDAYRALTNVHGLDVKFLWHEDSDIGGLELIILPGGFSYGDYLRTGAFARFSPIMRAVESFARSGGLVLGICNGFQVLLEAGLLPGAMLANKTLRFICDWVYIKPEKTDSPFTFGLSGNETLKIPIAHFEGNYFADDMVIDRLEKNKQVVFRYCDNSGIIKPDANPNGSINNIAGIANEMGNVLGMMPHPERATEKILGSDNGRMIFESILKWNAATKK